MAEELAEFYRRHRPQNFADLVGQSDAKRMLADMGKRGEIPHALLFVGPSGCGKTTLSRIVAAKLKCSGHDFQELNSADFRGIDAVRNIRTQMTAAPLFGSCRIWILDECQSLTSDAQDALLKMLEDTPKHVYFMLCTTDQQKLKKTILTRCTEIKCKALTELELTELIQRVAKAESLTITDKVVQRIIDAADGSGRKVLVILHAIGRLPDEVSQLSAITAADPRSFAIDICRKLMDGRSNWGDLSELLSRLEDDAEGVRRAVMGYCKSILLKNPKGNDRARQIMDEFRDPFYNNGVADLTMACYDVMFSK